MSEFWNAFLNAGIGAIACLVLFLLVTALLCWITWTTEGPTHDD